MSGHNKWSTIKRKKGANDAKRSKMFSKIIKEITVAVKEGGPSEDSNPRLRLAIQNAKSVNMPKDNVTRAISKADKDNTNLQEQTYEGYAPHGIALVVECLTDNTNRTVSNIRAIFSKKGGNLGNTGSLNFLFTRKGVFYLKEEGINLDDIELDLIDNGAEDIQQEDGQIIVTTAMEDFGNMQKKLDEMSIEIENAGLERIPHEKKELPIEDGKKVMHMIEAFEDDEDVQNVFHNLEITDELMAALEEE